MAEMPFYSIMKAVPSRTVRFGWVSSITGITYCGICLRSAVTPQVGAECKVCGAYVAQLLDIGTKGDKWRKTWKDAISVPRDSDDLQATRCVISEIESCSIRTETEVARKSPS